MSKVVSMIKATDTGRRSIKQMFEEDSFE